MIKKSQTPADIQHQLENLGKRLKELRLQKGHINQEKFAFENSISRVLHSNWEKGKGNITFKSLMKVLKALDVSPKEFFSEGFNSYIDEKKKK